MRIQWVLTLAAGVMCHAVAAAAQPLPPPEVGVGVAGITLASGGDLWGGGMESVGAEATGSLPLTGRFSLDLFSSYARRTVTTGYRYGVATGDVRRTEGVFGLTVKQRILSSEQPGFHAFLTYGVAGMYASETSSQRTAAYDRSPGLPFPVFGGGVQKNIGSHVAVRADAQALIFVFIPVGIRASVGMVVPIGTYAR